MEARLLLQVRGFKMKLDLMLDNNVQDDEASSCCLEQAQTVLAPLL